MDKTPFTRILVDLLGRIPGAYATSLVDTQGESVDYAGLVDPFDVKVAAAHFRLVLFELERFQRLGVPSWLVVRGTKRTIVARQLPDKYALVVLLRRRAGFVASSRAWAVCDRALAEEAGWSTAHIPRWFAADVRIDEASRPTLVNGHDVEVIGALVGERGFRVRTPVGYEATLVREARHHWYVDESLEDERGTEAVARRVNLRRFRAP